MSLLGVIAVANQANASAIVVPPHTQYVVSEGDAVERYSVMSASLIVNKNAQTDAIGAHQGSTVEVDGARVYSVGRTALDLLNSSAVVRNSVISAIKTPADSGNENAGIRMSSGSSASVIDSQVFGIGRGITLASGSTLTLDNTEVLGSDGADPIGAITGGVGVVLSASQAVIANGSQVSGDNNGVVLRPQNVNGVVSNSHVTIDASQVTGLQGSAILVAGGQEGAVPAAVIDVNNGSTLSGGNGLVLQVQTAGSAQLNVNNSHVSGDVRVNADSAADLSLANNASLTGNIANATSLNVDGSSTWVMEGDSSVGRLNLSGGSVDLRGKSDGFHTLNVGELSGEGAFALGTDLAAQQSDSLNVSGGATGTHQLLVQNSGVDPLQGATPQQLVHTGSGDAQFSLIGEKVDFGTFAYQLEQQQNGAGGTDWSLVQTEEASAGSRSVIGLFSAAPTVWYGESATLRSRMGELRNGNDQGGGWMRSYGNTYNMSAGGGVAYQQNQQGITFGADAPLPTSNGQWLVGVLGGYSKSDLDLKQGTSGEVDSYYVGAYSTWLADDGFYVDALIKANRFQNSSDVMMRDGEKSKGDYVNHGVGVSVEAGKHIKLDDKWFVEPFAQVTGLWVSGEDYDLDNGMQASSNQANSLLGKVGTQVGRTFALENGGFVQPYVKVAAAQEFVDANRVTINDNRFSNDLSGSRLELGTGVAAQLTEVLQVHADLDYMNGRNIEQPWGVNVGLRYNW